MNPHFFNKGKQYLTLNDDDHEQKPLITRNGSNSSLSGKAAKSAKTSTGELFAEGYVQSFISEKDGFLESFLARDQFGRNARLKFMIMWGSFSVLLASSTLHIIYGYSSAQSFFIGEIAFMYSTLNYEHNLISD